MSYFILNNRSAYADWSISIWRNAHVTSRFFFYGLAVPVMPNGHYGGSPMVDEAFTLTLHTSRNSNACYPLSYLVNYSIYLSLDCGVLISIYKCHCSFSRYFVLQISLL